MDNQTGNKDVTFFSLGKFLSFRNMAAANDDEKISSCIWINESGTNAARISKDLKGKHEPRWHQAREMWTSSRIASEISWSYSSQRPASSPADKPRRC